MASPAGGGGVTVSTLREAEVLAGAGYRDLLLTTPLAPAKLARVAELQSAGVRLLLTVSSQASARALSEAGTNLGFCCAVLLEIDVDGFRGGLPLEDDALKAVSRLPEIAVEGVLVYPGASSRLSCDLERAALGERHRQAAIRAAEMLRASGRSVPIRSFGSTSILMAMTTADGLTEHRGGVYVFQDLHQAGLGWCSRDDIALTVAATVVSHDPAHNRLFIDAGALALSKDRSTAGTPFDARYGWLIDPHDGSPIADLWVEEVFQEHGVVTSASGDPRPFARLPVGRVVAVQVNHADMTAAAYDTYHLVRDGEIVDRLHRSNGW